MEKQEQLFLNFQVIGSSKKLVPQAHDMEAGWCMVFATLEGLSHLQLESGASVLSNYWAHFDS